MTKPKKNKKIKAWVVINNTKYPNPFFATNWVNTPWGRLDSRSMLRIYLDENDANEDRIVNCGNVKGLLSIAEVEITIKTK